jgi:hypothetical protein
MRGRLFYCLGIVLLDAAFFTGSRGQSQSSQGVGAVKPFTVYQHEVMHSPDPKDPPIEVDRVVARRSDGSHMESFTTVSPAGEHGVVVGIREVGTGRAISLEPYTKSVSTRYHLSPDEMTEERGSLRSCTASQSALFSAAESLPKMLGHIVALDTAQNDDERSESWVALDLDCFPMQEISTRRGARNEFTVTRVEEGEPSVSLFTIPSDYVERSPGQIEAVYVARYGEPLYGFGRVLETLDSAYFSHQSK